MSTHNLCFSAKIRKIMYTPVNSSFTRQKWGLRGSKLYRHVFVMDQVTNYTHCLWCSDTLATNLLAREASGWLSG